MRYIKGFKQLNEATSPEEGARRLIDKLVQSKLLDKKNEKKAIDVLTYLMARGVHEGKSNLNESDIKIKVKGKTIKIDYDSIEIEDIDMKDYPDFSDAFISYAEDHRGKELSDEELDVLNDEHYDLVGEIIFDKQLY